MADKVVLGVNKVTKTIGWILSAVALILLLGTTIFYWDSILQVDWISWMALGALILMAFLLPYLNKIRGVIITEKDITVNLLYRGKPIPLNEIEEVHFISNWGFPKRGKNILNIDTRLNNRKEAAEFLKDKVKLSGTDKIK